MNINTLLPGSILEWKNQEYHLIYIFPTFEEAKSWLETEKAEQVWSETINLLSGRFMLLATPRKEIGIFFLHIFLDGKIGWVVMDKWETKQLEVLD